MDDMGTGAGRRNDLGITYFRHEAREHAAKAQQGTHSKPRRVLAKRRDFYRRHELLTNAQTVI